MNEKPSGETKEENQMTNVENLTRELKGYTQTFSIESIFRKMDKGDLVIDESKANSWSKIKISRFVESILMRLPTSLCYFVEKLNNGRKVYQTIDGSQRLDALRKFLNDEVKLEGLEVFPEYNGLVFSELPNNQNILNFVIPSFIINLDVDERFVKIIISRLTNGYNGY